MRIRPLHLHEANAFVAAHHRHCNPVRGCKFCIGLVHANELVGVAIAGRPVARELDDTLTIEVLRVCVIDDAPRNANSKLYGACWRIWRQMGGERVVTYTLEHESGDSLRGAGYTVVAQLNGRKKAWESRTDSPWIDRDWSDVYGQRKLRWER